MFYLTRHTTHFIYGYMASDIWLRTILIVRNKTCSHHIGYSFRLTAMVLLYAPSHRQDSTYHSLCYTSCGALWVHPMKDRSDDPSHHERMLLPQSYISLPIIMEILGKTSQVKDKLLLYVLIFSLFQTLLPPILSFCQLCNWILTLHRTKWLLSFTFSWKYGLFVNSEPYTLYSIANTFYLLGAEMSEFGILFLFYTYKEKEMFNNTNFFKCI